MARPIAVLFVSLLVLAGCQMPTQSTSASIQGSWKSSGGDSYSLNGTSFLYDDSWGFGWAGTVVATSDQTLTTGSLTIQVTDGKQSGKATGTFAVVRWKSLTSKAAQITTGGLTQNKVWVDTQPTQAAAEALFTEANGAFGLYGDYTRQ